MKKVIAIFLALFYLSASSGMGINLHFCMNKMVNWTLYQSKTKNCSSCGMAKKESTDKKCCKDIQHLTKVDKSQQVVNHVFNFEKQIVLDLLPVFSYHILLQEQNTLLRGQQSNAPPLGLHIPIFIKHCTYRI